ncbi:MAG: ABC-F family ATP-binding cassette domain-containing protein [Candidatus Magasanikbacteria bacterium]|nr:ABC-F family ATP-binding cassette domain-containing protein [Candidatus Magasanikbacteria bacterium]
MAENVILSFDNVSFEYQDAKPVLNEASFTVRNNTKITLMGQNGAGKSTIFSLIRRELQPQSGQVNILNGLTVGSARQMMARSDLALTVEEYFAKAFLEKPANLRSRIAKALDAVNFSVLFEKVVGQLSGGQQARLLLAFALIQNPDILLLDEPTNNLDQAGIDHLIQFLVMYDKTVIVISHDADFLNSFTDGVIYLDVFTKKIETYVGDYYSVVEEIKARIEREQMKNAQLEKSIQDRKDKVNFFAHKGGKMRKLASKLKEEAAEMEENKVDVRREDKTIRDFVIPNQEIVGNIVQINKIKIIQDHKPVAKEVNLVMRQKTRLLITGPNGIGKSTLLRSLVHNTSPGVKIMAGAKVGYYSQDFAALDFDNTVFESLKSSCGAGVHEEEARSVAAGFLISGKLMDQTVANLSEGQKGLLSFAKLVLEKPGLLVLDEPTNHINFRHLPVIARAIHEYKGAIILISHSPEFVKQIKVDETLDLGRL